MASMRTVSKVDLHRRIARPAKSARIDSRVKNISQKFKAASRFQLDTGAKCLNFENKSQSEITNSIAKTIVPKCEPYSGSVSIQGNDIKYRNEAFVSLDVPGD
jgi:hypothetical protein